MRLWSAPSSFDSSATFFFHLLGFLSTSGTRYAAVAPEVFRR